MPVAGSTATCPDRKSRSFAFIPPAAGSLLREGNDGISFCAADPDLRLSAICRTSSRSSTRARRRVGCQIFWVRQMPALPLLLHRRRVGPDLSAHPLARRSEINTSAMGCLGRHPDWTRAVVRACATEFCVSSPRAMPFLAIPAGDPCAPFARNGRNYLAIRSVERRRPCRCPSPYWTCRPRRFPAPRSSRATARKLPPYRARTRCARRVPNGEYP